jgi:hypothetical protein
MVGCAIVRHASKPLAEPKDVEPIIITIPNIQDVAIIYNEDETRRIFRFSQPASGAEMDGLAITDVWYSGREY